MKRLLAVVALACAGCPSRGPLPAQAYRISSREQLIGGLRALGEIGDFKLENGLIQAVVQDVGYSRGSAVFGGSLIDVDLVRGAKRSALTGGAGQDSFTEMFPVFLLQAVAPTSVEVLSSGSDGKSPAIVRVSGEGGEFFSASSKISDALITTRMDYTVDYILEPGKRFLKIVVTISNPSGTQSANFPLSIPFGFVNILSSGQKLFVPGKAGYDIRYRMDDVFKQPASLEAFPGEVTNMVTAEGPAVSYGLVADPDKGTPYLRKPAFYPTAKSDSVLVLLAHQSIFATYWGQPPSTLGPGKSYQFAGYLAVGTGDAASVQETIYELKGTATGRVSGHVREVKSHMAVEGAAVVLQDEHGDFVSSARTRKGGLFTARVPPGRYRAWAVSTGRTSVASAEAVGDYFEVREGQVASVELEVGRPATLVVSVVDERGRPLPSKISVEAVHGFEPGKLPREFLFDLRLGEPARQTDFLPDDGADPTTREYLEAVFFAPTGKAARRLRPGRYRIFASRGMEYSLESAEVEIAPGEEKEVGFVVRQVMPTPGYVSGDFHVHTNYSVDSNISPDDRVSTFAAEGVDCFTSSDHNYVSDLEPAVQRQGLSDWLKTIPGIELTSLEVGHFNAFPIRYQPGPVTHGSFAWVRRPPGELFAQLRGIGKLSPEQTLVQVNHPRDGLQGYFSAFNVGGYTSEPVRTAGGVFSLDRRPGADGSPSPYAFDNFSMDFDVLEVLNGKRSDLLFNYRIPPPEEAGEGEEPTVPLPPVGTVLENNDNPRQPVYPGVLDDYYRFLGHGRRLTAVGNSDTHGVSSEAGIPRTYVYLGDAAELPMRVVPEERVVDALREQRAIVTNGPFPELWVNGQPVGSKLVAPDGKVDVRIRVQAAPWVDVSTVVLKRGSSLVPGEPEVLETIPVGPSDQVDRLEWTKSFTVPDGSFLVVEVTGKKSLWPVVTPYENRGIELMEALGRIAEPLGFGPSQWGRYHPQQLKRVTPFAVTNPVWVDRTARQPLLAPRPVLPPGAPGGGMRKELPNLLRLLEALHGE